jgi:hypothetical protein
MPHGSSAVLRAYFYNLISPLHYLSACRNNALDIGSS